MWLGRGSEAYVINQEVRQVIDFGLADLLEFEVDVIK
jgi:hypothetical protein